MTPPVPSNPSNSTGKVKDPRLASTTSIRYGSAMLRRFGWFYHLLGFGLLFRRIQLSDTAVERMRRAALKGPVVYVLHYASNLDYLALNTVLNRRRLPLSVWANRITNFWWQPVIRAWKELGFRIRAFFSQGPALDPIESGWLAQTILENEPTTLFLRGRQHPLFFSSYQNDLQAVQVLLDAQNHTTQPIQLIPIALVWNRAPDATRQPVQEFLLGTKERPRLLTRLKRIYFNSKNAFVQVGEPLALTEFRARTQSKTPERTLHTLLRRYLRRESDIIRGPRLPRHKTMKHLVLNNPPMRTFAQQFAADTQQNLAQVKREMSKNYDQIAARFSWRTIQFLSLILTPVWTRIFSGVNIREEDMERIREAMHSGTAVLIPCHKSHMDYLLLSWLFHKHQLVVPHVVAGINMAIWPISIILRGGGAFFIKRSLSGEAVFHRVFRRYLRELVRQGFPLEFFIEGGRSRNGQLLPPKLGVLRMVLDAAEWRPSRREVTLLPIAIAYEQVAEEGAYARELHGEEKRPESLRSFMRLHRVLRHRFGRVYLRVGSPIPCSPIVDSQQDGPSWSEQSSEVQEATTEAIGQRVVYRIGQAVIVLPSSLVAMALLTHHRRAIHHWELKERVTRLLELTKQLGAEHASSLNQLDLAITQALSRFHKEKRIRALVHENERVWAIEPDQRSTLGYYKNQLLHLFAPAGLVALSIRGHSKDQFQKTDLLATLKRLSILFYREFIFDPDFTDEDLLSQGIETLLGCNAIARSGEQYTVDKVENISEIYGLFLPLLEGYRAVIEQGSLAEPILENRAMLADILQEQREALLSTGQVQRPEALSTTTIRNGIRGAIISQALKEDSNGCIGVGEQYEAYSSLLSGMLTP